MRIEDFSPRLQRGPEGLYRSSTVVEVSYAADGHDECFGIEDQSFWFRHRNNCISEMVGRHPFNAAPLLDIGGGNGFVAQRLQQDGHEVVLIEPGQAGALNAHRHRKLPNVVCATVEDAQFAPETFGAVGMFDVIEHIETDRQFLENAVHPLLVPGGRLYLTVPCHSWLWSRADVDAGHFRRHTLSSLEDLMSGLFQIDYATYFFRPLLLPQFLLRALPYKMGFGRNGGVLDTEAEHGTGAGFAVDAVERLLAPEVNAIRQGRRMTTGASALLAATRI